MVKGLKFSLSKKAFAAVFLILLPIIVTFIYSYSKNERRLKEHLLEDLTIISEVFEAQVYQFMEMSRRRTVDFSSDGLVKQGLIKHRRGESWPADALSQHLIKNKLPLDKYIHDIYIIDIKGRVLASSDPASVGMDFSGKNFFVNGLKGDAYSEISRGNQVYPEIAIASLVSDEGAAVGMVVCFIRVSELDKILNGEFARELGAISWAKGRRHTFEAYLVNKDRLMITGSKFIKDSILKQAVNTEPVRQCLDHKKELTGFYTDYRGVPVAGSSMCLPSLGWTLLVEIDSEEALATVTQMRNDALITGFIVAGLIGLLFAFFYKTIVLQLRRLSQAAGLIAAGTYDVNIPVGTNDEIGGLSESFNKMVSDIRTRDTALRQSEEKYRSLISNIPDVTWIATEDGKTVFVSDNVADVTGYAGEEVKDLAALRSELAHRDDAATVLKAFKGLFSEASAFDVEYRLRTKDDRWLWVRDRATSTYVKDGVKYADGMFTDITKRKTAEEALKDSEHRLREAQHVAMLGSWDWDIPNDRLFWSEEIYNIFGISPEKLDATYELFIKCVHEDDREFVERSVFDALYNGKKYAIDHRIVRPGGEERIVHEQAEVKFSPDGKPVRMLGTVQDLTENKRIEFELKKLSAAIENSVNIVFITDAKGTIEYVNPTFEQATGYTKAEAIGQNPRILSSGELANEKYEELWKTILSGKTWRSVLKNKKKTGGFYWANSVISPIRNERAEITHFLAVQEDITEKMISEERIKYLAQYDELTGLINRTHFIELLDEWIALAQVNRSSGAMLLLDMDQFKFLNDTYGHGTGDEFLRRAGNLFNSTLEDVYSRGRKDGYSLISRLSGDEFAIFISGVDESEAFGIAEKMRRSMEGFRFAEFLSTSTVSIGIVLYPVHGLNTRELFTRADAAMYRAKELGRNKCHLYRPEDQDLEKMHSRLSWREKILKALKEDRFEPWFQPILNLKDDRIHHYEVLARLRAEDGKILLPGAFIDIAERFSLIGAIDRTITGKAIEMQAKTMREGRRYTFGMNLSGKDLGDEELLSFLRARIEQTGADPGCLLFEITETAAIGDLGRAIKFVKELKQIGCKFALDDFGVGFTSFNYLKELNVDFIKIDGSFIRKIHESPNDQVFVKAITDVARGLKIKSIAEFVETEETLEILKSFGVDYAQGYLIGKPSPTLAHESLHSPEVKQSAPKV